MNDLIRAVSKDEIRLRQSPKRNGRSAGGRVLLGWNSQPARMKTGYAGRIIS
jgi:hypothetical protein